MEDKDIEQLLRESWQPEPPQGMRARVLNRARRELRPRWHFLPRLSLPRWQKAFALASVVIVVSCAISDTVRENRIARLECPGTNVQSCTLVARRPLTLGQSRLQMCKLLQGSQDELLGP